MSTPRNRDYSSPPDTFHSMSATYVWNPYCVITGANGLTTGAWSSAELSQDGSLRVSLTSGINIDSLNISGLVVNTDQLEVINTSGTQYLASISGRLNNGLIGVTGTRPDIASGYSTGYYVMIGGRAVEVASGFNPQYASGGNAMLNLDRANGALLTENTDLNYNYDSIIAYSPQSSTVSNSSISGSFTATALQTGIAIYANTGRKAWFIANTSSVAPLYVRLGSSTVSTGNFSFILNASSAAGSQGGSWIDSPSAWIGDVSVSGQSFISWEI